MRACVRACVCEGGRMTLAYARAGERGCVVCVFVCVFSCLVVCVWVRACDKGCVPHTGTRKCTHSACG